MTAIMVGLPEGLILTHCLSIAIRWYVHVYYWLDQIQICSLVGKGSLEFAYRVGFPVYRKFRFIEICPKHTDNFFLE